ncbi:DNA primase [Ottowia testudinis]|uniref:DNA primase n=1 Tax=Ottowia testudinis TaxID=2816950 RepID=A0A975CIJ3_9BURK|nr:DNA primase [Ottowia testudinis]QTD46985.1 DNA primase [Ottowia testudinis]
MAIPQHFIQELLARADVVEIVGRYVQLKKTGANFSGLCPFHGEKSPSFTVSPSKQFYHCFGCGKNGNAIGFLMDHTGAGFVEVVHDLAQQYGLQVPEDERSPADRARAAQETEKRHTLTDVLARAGEAYKKHLRDTPRAVDYLKKRGLSGEIARDYGLGYAPEGWRTLAGVFPDYADPLLQESGLVIVGEDDDTRRYDRFRDRIMFPIRSVKGEVIGFGGRVLGDEKPKYLNSPETPVFHKGRELYGLFEARTALREHGYALVTEGYMDVVALAQLGFGNAVATLGTACTPDHASKLFRFTDQVVFSFDGDAAGRRAAHKALEAALPLASDTRSVKFLFLPPEHDPDSFIRAEGPEAFGQAVKNAVPLSRFLLDVATEECDMATAEGRSRFAANARPLWQLLPPGALAQQLLGDVAAQVQIGVHELESLWGIRRASPRNYENNSYSRSPDKRQRPKTFEKPAGRPLRRPPAGRCTRALQIVLTEPSAWDRLSQDEHVLLCDLPPPLGPLFTWLAGQALDHGPQPWSALREALRGHEFESVAVEEVQKLPPDIVSEPDELRGILRTERREQLKRHMDAALADGDMAHYQALLRALTEGEPQPPA